MGVREAQIADRRRLRGEKARRIVEAMRASVAEVGIADSTFDRVSAGAGVSRGLLHYYFGTKERLLVEVIRRDTEYRIAALGGALRDAKDVDQLIAALSAILEQTLSDQRGYVYMVSELLVAGRHNPEIRRELGELYGRGRTEFADILRAKEREGVIAPRFDPETVIGLLFAAGDGAGVQQLSDPTFDGVACAAAASEVARFLLAPA
jgi:AcrR family transcriptional regulator